ncbi:MAG: hypothetical protein KDE56_16230 [Anaerolineales bacterium]|nr:hypothetical protein [Anaerolineales bacterium]
MTVYTHSIHVSQAVYRQIEMLAKMQHRSVEMVADETLKRLLLPAVDHIPQRFQADLQQLTLMSDDMLWRLSDVDLDDNKATLYEALLELNQARQLSPDEQNQLDILREEADLLMFRRSYALLLLKRRGYDVSTPPEQLDK